MAFEKTNPLDTSPYSKQRFSLPESDVIGWTDEDNAQSPLNRTSILHNHISLRKKSECMYNPFNKKTITPQLPDSTSSFKIHTQKISHPLQIMYKISKINLNDKQIFIKENTKNKHNQKTKLPNIIKKKITSVIFPHPKKPRKLHNNSFITEISDVLNLLKLERKNPIRTLITPQLLSKSVLYKSFSKRKAKRSIDFSFLQCISPELNTTSKQFKEK